MFVKNCDERFHPSAPPGSLRRLVAARAAGYEEKVVALASCLRRASQRRQQGSAMSLMNSVLGGDLKSMWDDRKRAMDMEEVKAAR